MIFLEGEKSKAFAKAPTQWMALIPTVYNADTLGIRPDLIKRPIDSWAELLNPEFKGKAAILNIPSIGIMDAAMVVEAKGLYKYPDKGNMTKTEIDLTIKTLIEAKKAGQFRSLWKDFNESVNLMASGEVVIQSMWSPAVTAVRVKGIACTFQPLKEGYRAWAAGFGLPATLSGKKLDARLRVHQLVPRRLGRRLPQPPGLLLAPCSTPPRPRWSPTSGPTGWKASPRRRTSSRPTATLLAKAGSSARRRLVRAAHGRHRLLERADGREHVHGPEVERVRGRLNPRSAVMRRAGDGPPAWLQALPFAAVFVFFFVAPLLLVGAVSLWPTSDYELKPGFTLRQLRDHLRRLRQPGRAVRHAEDLLVDAALLARGLGGDAGARLRDRLLPRLPRALDRRRRRCSSSSARSRSGPRT